MLIRIFKICFLLFVLSSCKKTEVAGRVYSKYDVPIAGADITLMMYASSKYADKTVVATTDGDGYYSFKFKAKRSNNYFVTCITDTGATYGKKINTSETNHIDLKFQ